MGSCLTDQARSLRFMPAAECFLRLLILAGVLGTFTFSAAFFLFQFDLWTAISFGVAVPVCLVLILIVLILWV